MTGRWSVALRRSVAVGLLAAAWALVARPATAQWVEEPGTGWVDVTVYHQDTRERFASDGDIREFFSDGHAVSTSVFVTVAAGLFPGVDAWVQAPYQRLRFDDAVRQRVRSGVGDTRVYLRVKPTEYLGLSLPLTLRGGVKLPVGDFSVGSEVIPLGDGQTDWELMAEVGHSFHPFPAYVNGWIGYRWREENEEALRDFGDEVFFLAQVGGQAGPVGLQVVAEGWDGQTPVIEGFRVPNAQRAMLQVTPSVSYGLGPGSVRVGLQVPLAGKNLPAGPALVVGYFSGWSL